MPKTCLRPATLMFQPRPTYPYSPGAMAGGWIFTAGQVAWDRRGRLVGPRDVRAQTVQTLKNVLAVLAEGGAGPADVLKCNVYLKDMRDFQIMNEEFARVFAKNPPARTTVQASLAEAEMLVEIEAVAFVGTGGRALRPSAPRNRASRRASPRRKTASARPARRRLPKAPRAT
jgi:reactive intermediate/imine deaminase